MAQKKQEKSIFDTLSEDKKDFFIQSLEKKVRSINKKLKEIKQLEVDQKEGKDLKEAQLSKIASKEELVSKRKEYEGIAKLYLEAKTEFATEKKETVQTETTTSTTDSVTETVKQFVDLFFATKYAYQTNTNATLSQYYTDVFNSGKRTRVEDATTELTSYLSGEKSTLKEEVTQVVAQEGFLSLDAQFDTVGSTSTSPVQEEKQENVEEVQQSEETTNQTTDNVQKHEVEVEVPQTNYQEEEKPVEQVHEEKQSSVKEVTEQQEQPEHPQVETTGEQVVTTVEQGETAKEQQGEKKFYKKHYQNYQRNSGGYKKPREYKEGENQQTEGYDKRAPRPYNGPRQGGNRSNKRTNEGENQNNRNFNNQENENTNQVKATVDDGWNVVQKGPKTQDGGYKPRREVGNQNYNNQKRTGDHVNKRPNHSGNKRPFNKERTAGEQQQYVRKENPTVNIIFFSFKFSLHKTLMIQ